MRRKWGRQKRREAKKEGPIVKGKKEKQTEREREMERDREREREREKKDKLFPKSKKSVLKNRIFHNMLLRNFFLLFHS